MLRVNVPAPFPPPVTCGVAQLQALTSRALMYDSLPPCPASLSGRELLFLGGGDKAVPIGCNLPKAGDNVDGLLADAGEQCVLWLFLH